GLEHINGALTQADVLGIFGRENFDLATLWDPPTGAQPGAYAFRMFRNYDGTGKRFGQTSVAATSSDQSAVSVYAAERASDGALTIMVINKSTSDQASTLTLSYFQAAANANVYRYSAANLNAVVAVGTATVNSNVITSTYPASSITLLVVPASGVASNCVLDIDGDLRLTPDVDGVLLLRYLLGFRGAALTQGITFAGTRNNAAAIETFIGNANAFDVFGRTPPQAMNDGLVLMRVLSGVPDASLLNGISIPSGATYANASAVRGNVNSKCTTQF
ncbi:MAG: hypothetical protein ABIZ64_11555, partial [Casimicrobium sp.]